MEVPLFDLFDSEGAMCRLIRVQPEAQMAVSYGKRVNWVHSDQTAHLSFWVSVKKCDIHFGFLGPEKRPKRPVLGHRRENPNRWLRQQNFGRFGLLNFLGLIHKRQRQNDKYQV